MAWMSLFLAGVMEIGWPLGLKVSQDPDRRMAGLALAVACMSLSGALLWFAQKTIPLGTAYAIWTGIGAAGTFVVGVIWFGDSTGVFRILSAFLIIAGVIGLRLTHPSP